MQPLLSDENSRLEDFGSLQNSLFQSHVGSPDFAFGPPMSFASLASELFIHATTSTGSLFSKMQSGMLLNELWRKYERISRLRSGQSAYDIDGQNASDPSVGLMFQSAIARCITNRRYSSFPDIFKKRRSPNKRIRLVGSPIEEIHNGQRRQNLQRQLPSPQEQVVLQPAGVFS
jgi:hypothetical protein